MNGVLAGELLSSLLCSIMLLSKFRGQSIVAPAYGVVVAVVVAVDATAVAAPFVAAGAVVVVAVSAGVVVVVAVAVAVSRISDTLGLLPSQDDVSGRMFHQENLLQDLRVSLLDDHSLSAWLRLGSVPHLPCSYVSQV